MNENGNYPGASSRDISGFTLLSDTEHFNFSSLTSSFFFPNNPFSNTSDNPGLVQYNNDMSLNPEFWGNQDKIIPELIEMANMEYPNINYKSGENDCDIYLEWILIYIGEDPLDYLAGPAVLYSVKDHIDALENKKSITHVKKDKNPFLKEGAYVVLMDEGDNEHTDGTQHSGILVVKDDQVIVYQMTSANKIGNEIETYSNVLKFQAFYGYKDFYYKRIR